MRHFLTILFFTLCLCTHGQTDLKGKWYTFSMDMVKVAQYDFTETNFVINKKDWELKSLPGTQTFKVLEVVKLNSNLYYLLQNEADTNKITLTIISSFQPDKSFTESTASEEHTSFKNIKDARTFIQSDTVLRPGLVFYSEKEFNRLKSFPNPLTISKSDFKTYLIELIKSRKRFTDYADLHRDDFGFMFLFFYLSNQSRVILAKLIYNPVIADSELSKVYDKFENDNELKDLFQSALKFKD